jgi:hypothetical protein
MNNAMQALPPPARIPQSSARRRSLSHFLSWKPEDTRAPDASDHSNPAGSGAFEQGCFPAQHVYAPQRDEVGGWREKMVYSLFAVSVALRDLLGGFSLSICAQAFLASLQRSLNLSANKYYYYYCVITAVARYGDGELAIMSGRSYASETDIGNWIISVDAKSAGYAKLMHLLTDGFQLAAELDSKA